VAVPPVSRLAAEVQAAYRAEGGRVALRVLAYPVEAARVAHNHRAVAGLRVGLDAGTFPFPRAAVAAAVTNLPGPTRSRRVSALASEGTARWCEWGAPGW
jgi:hypothetical protein